MLGILALLSVCLMSGGVSALDRDPIVLQNLTQSSVVYFDLAQRLNKPTDWSPFIRSIDTGLSLEAKAGWRVKFDLLERYRPLGLVDFGTEENWRMSLVLFMPNLNNIVRMSYSKKGNEVLGSENRQGIPLPVSGAIPSAAVIYSSKGKPLDRVYFVSGPTLKYLDFTDSTWKDSLFVSPSEEDSVGLEFPSPLFTTTYRGLGRESFAYTYRRTNGTGKDNTKVLFVTENTAGDGAVERILDVNAELERLQQNATLSRLLVFSVADTSVPQKGWFPVFIYGDNSVEPTSEREGKDMYFCLMDVSSLTFTSCILVERYGKMDLPLGIQTEIDQSDVNIRLLINIGADGEPKYRVRFWTITFDLTKSGNDTLSLKVMTESRYEVQAKLDPISDFSVKSAGERFIRISAGNNIPPTVQPMLSGAWSTFYYGTEEYVLYPSSTGGVIGVSPKANYIVGFKPSPTVKASPTGEGYSAALSFLDFIRETESSGDVRVNALFRSTSKLQVDTPISTYKYVASLGEPLLLQPPQLDLSAKYFTENMTGQAGMVRVASEYSFRYFSLSETGLPVEIPSSRLIVARDFIFDLSRGVGLRCRTMYTDINKTEHARICKEEQDLWKGFNSSDSYTVERVEISDTHIVALVSKYGVEGSPFFLAIFDIEARSIVTDSFPEFVVGEVMGGERAAKCVFTRAGFYWFYSPNTDKPDLYALYFSWDRAKRINFQVGERYWPHQGFAYRVTEGNSTDNEVQVAWKNDADASVIGMASVLGGSVTKNSVLTTLQGKVKEVEELCLLSSSVVVSDDDSAWVADTDGTLTKVFGPGTDDDDDDDDDDEKGDSTDPASDGPSLVCLPREDKVMLIISNPTQENKYFILQQVASKVVVLPQLFPDRRITVDNDHFYLGSDRFTYSFRDSQGSGSRQFNFDAVQVPTSHFDILVQNNASMTSFSLPIQIYGNPSAVVNLKSEITTLDRNRERKQANISLNKPVEVKAGAWRAEIAAPNGTHFWKLQTLANEAVTEDRFGIKLFTSVPAVYWKYTGFIPGDKFDVYLWNRHIMVCQKDAYESCWDDLYKMDEAASYQLLSLEALAWGGTSYALLVKVDRVDSVKIVQITIDMVGDQKVSMTESEIIGGLKVTDHGFKTSIVDRKAAVGYIHWEGSSTLRVVHPACSSNVLTTVPGVRSYTLFTGSQTEKLVYLVYTLYNSTAATFSSLNIQTCKETKVEIPSEENFAATSAISCKSNDQGTSVSCLFGGLQHYHLDMSVDKSNGFSLKIGRTDRYEGYKNMQVDTIFIQEGNSTREAHFIVKGSRINAWNGEPAKDYYDSSGILYYKLKVAGGDGYAFGGLTNTDLARKGVLEKTGLWMANGDYYLSTTPLPQKLVVSEPSIIFPPNGFDNLVFNVLGQQVANVTLSQPSQVPSKKSDSTGGAMTFWMIGAGIVILTMLGVLFLVYRSTQTPQPTALPSDSADVQSYTIMQQSGEDNKL